jgi:hypothetical protein
MEGAFGSDEGGFEFIAQAEGGGERHALGAVEVAAMQRVQ